MNVGDYIKSKRTSLGISAREASLRAGLSPSYVSKLEAGTIECSFKAFAKLAVGLGMSEREVYLVIRNEA